MTVHGKVHPFVLLVDDDTHSARLLTRMLLAHGSPAVERIDGAEPALAHLRDLLPRSAANLPGLLIVDLKATSTATRDFVAAVRKLKSVHALSIAAMAPSLERAVRETLLDAGADAVFERHAEIGAYRSEVASIVSFWVRNQRLEAVGT